MLRGFVLDDFCVDPPNANWRKWIKRRDGTARSKRWSDRSNVINRNITRSAQKGKVEVGELPERSAWKCKFDLVAIQEQAWRILSS